MCGLTGFLRPGGFSDVAAEEIIRRMSKTLTHRGPDDTGVWLDGDAGVALGHRRLAIIDLSQAGHQPMISASGRYVIAFNGEIYNHLSIRKSLQEREPTLRWRGDSDTEVFLAAIDCWGVESALERSVGMFAVALWDRKDRTLTLARDRVGEKPLYYGWQGDSLLFGSELKALRAHPEFRANIDRSVLAMYMRRGFIEAPYSIYENIFKLQPGTYMQFTANPESGRNPQPKTYWSLLEVIERGSAEPFAGSDEEAVEELDAHLRNAVALQTGADVPVGVFLSGGTDSTTVVALMQEAASRPVKTFTIGFHESSYNEAGHAKLVAQYLGTDHTELYATPKEAMDLIPILPTIYDEPFGDSSAIPTLLVSQLARQQVTVSLSGDGGDELFGGYTRYKRTEDIWNRARHLPRSVNAALTCGARTFSRLTGRSKIGRRADRLGRYLSSKSIGECYENHILQRHDAHDLVLGSDTITPQERTPSIRDFGDNVFNAMMYADTMSYLPDDILTKVDRAAMSVSLETRVPLLDHRVVEFAWRLPQNMKVRENESKWLLKQVMHKYVPESLMGRPKSGFGMPVSDWVRGPMREWAESMLSEERLQRDGFLSPKLVREQWLGHVNGPMGGDESHWQVLAFQAWLADVTESSTNTDRH